MQKLMFVFRKSCAFLVAYPEHATLKSASLFFAKDFASPVSRARNTQKCFALLCEGLGHLPPPDFRMHPFAQLTHAHSNSAYSTGINAIWFVFVRVRSRSYSL